MVCNDEGVFVIDLKTLFDDNTMGDDFATLASGQLQNADGSNFDLSDDTVAIKLRLDFERLTIDNFNTLFNGRFFYDGSLTQAAIAGGNAYSGGFTYSESRLGQKLTDTASALQRVARSKGRTLPILFDLTPTTIPKSVKGNGEVAVSLNLQAGFAGSPLLKPPMVASECNVVAMEACFYGCESLIEVMSTPPNITNIDYVYANTLVATTAPIKEGVTSAKACYWNAPVISVGAIESDNVDLTCFLARNVNPEPNEAGALGQAGLTQSPKLPEGFFGSLSYCFMGQTAVTTVVNIPPLTTSLQHTFEGCTALTVINDWEVDASALIKKNAAAMDGCFIGCDALMAINCPDKIKVVEDKWRLYTLDLRRGGRVQGVSGYTLKIYESNKSVTQCKTFEKDFCSSNELSLYTRTDELMCQKGENTSALVENVLTLKMPFGTSGDFKAEDKHLVINANEPDKVESNAFLRKVGDDEKSGNLTLKDGLTVKGGATFDGYVGVGNGATVRGGVQVTSGNVTVDNGDVAIMNGSLSTGRDVSIKTGEDKEWLENSNTWSVARQVAKDTAQDDALEARLNALQTAFQGKLDALTAHVWQNNKPVMPIGACYLQLCGMTAPINIYSTPPDSIWQDVTQYYRGLFFRADGGLASVASDFEHFSSDWIIIQKEQLPNVRGVTNSDSLSRPRHKGAHIAGVRTSKTSGDGSGRGMDIDFSAAAGSLIEGSGDSRVYADSGIYVDNGEVRPRNTTMRIWQVIRVGKSGEKAIEYAVDLRRRQHIFASGIAYDAYIDLFSKMATDSNMRFQTVWTPQKPIEVQTYNKYTGNKASIATKTETYGIRFERLSASDGLTGYYEEIFIHLFFTSDFSRGGYKSLYIGAERPRWHQMQSKRDVQTLRIIFPEDVVLTASNQPTETLPVLI